MSLFQNEPQQVIQKLLTMSILATIALVPTWYRMPYAPQPFTLNYIMGYRIFIPIMFTIALWLLAGVPGVTTLRDRPIRVMWLFAFFLLVLWAGFSVNWSFMRGSRPEVALSGVFQLGLVFVFALIVLCAGPPSRQIIYLLLISLVLHGVLGAIQVARQESAGLFWLGEFLINLQKPGISVIQAGDVRWLRPYGLTAHPNMYAGFMCVALLACGPMILAEKRFLRWVGSVLALFGLWMLLLTFSRGAWLALICAGGMQLILNYKTILSQSKIRRHVLITGSLAVILSGLFFVMYENLMLARAGVGAEYTEQRSVNDRLILLDIAGEAIKERPLNGVGISNFPWYASYYLVNHKVSENDIQGDHVHQVYVSIWAELGLIGLVLYVLVVGSGFWIFAAGLRSRRVSRDVIALTSGVVALLIIGMFDHYPWSLIHFQLLFFTLLAIAIKQVDEYPSVSGESLKQVESL